MLRAVLERDAGAKKVIWLQTGGRRHSIRRLCGKTTRRRAPRRGPRSRPGCAGALRIEVQGRTGDRALLSPVLVSRIAAQRGVLAKLLQGQDVARDQVILEMRLPQRRLGGADRLRGGLKLRRRDGLVDECAIELGF